jgi:anti-sigma B factor antagonist
VRAGIPLVLMEMSRFPVTATGGRTIVRLSGEVDVFTAGSLRQAIDGARHRHRGDIDVVTSDVTFMDSAALHVLVHAQRTLRMEGRILRVVEPSETVRRLVLLSGAERLYGEPAPA